MKLQLRRREWLEIMEAWLWNGLSGEIHRMKATASVEGVRRWEAIAAAIGEITKLLADLPSGPEQQCFSQYQGPARLRHIPRRVKVMAWPRRQRPHTSRCPASRDLCRANGFDGLRLFLAVSIVTFHSVTLTQAGPALYPPLRAAFWLILPSFFALSGYLVAASLHRCNSVLEFLALRLLRMTCAMYSYCGDGVGPRAVALQFKAC